MAKPSKTLVAFDVASLAATSLVLLVTFVVNALGISPYADKFGFKNSTAAISDKYSTQVTPAGYTFAIWSVIYLWQILWVLYAWTFTCRPNATRTIFSGVYIGYAITNAFNIAWIYLWGNEHVVASCVTLFLFNVAIYPTIGLLFGDFKMVQANATKSDIILTRSLPMNGLCFYATWTTIASLINLTVVGQYKTSISASNMATISLTILLAVLLLYFALENTILDNFGFRYVYSVYPVVIWALVGELSAHWGKKGEGRNSIYTLVLLVVTVVLFVAKLALVPLFNKYRQHGKKVTTTAEKKLYTAASTDEEL